MSLGYCCLIWGIYHTNYQTLKLSNVSDEKLRQIIEYNLESLNNAIDFNIENKVKFFRLSSDIIPFASSPVNQINWLKDYKKQLTLIGDKIKQAKMRVSFHPGQYSVLSSPDSKVIENTIKDLEYHASFLDALGLDYSHKMVIHIGGVYGDKKSAMERFATNFKRLSKSAQNRLILENDDKSYHTDDALALSKKIKAPVVYDNFHNSILTSDKKVTDREWIKLCAKTWLKKDGKPKIHYSTQQPNAIKGTHSYNVNIKEFIKFYNQVKDLDIDIMLEVKDKNIAVLKLINILEQNGDKQLIKTDYQRFKYWLMAINPSVIKTLENELLKPKFDPIKFYELIDQTIAIQPKDSLVNDVLELMLKSELKMIKKDEKEQLEQALNKARLNKLSLSSLKANFYKYAQQYQASSLLNSYLFNF